MTALYVLVGAFGVDHRRRDVGVAEDTLDLLDRHPALYRQGGECMAEYVRRDVRADFGAREHLGYIAP